MSDQRIECIDCGQVFTWTEGERQFYRQHGLSAPKRCPQCRRQRKWERSQSSAFDGPAARGGLLAFGLVLALGLFVWWVSPSMTPVRAWLVSINLAAFCAFVYDKLTAKLDAERVPEKILLGLSAAGGTVGAILGMLAAHHKTAKTGFKIRLLGVALLQVLAVLVYGQLAA
jgi:uncharacterized membrane protein YsdA (DUF1294 family)